MYLIKCLFGFQGASRRLFFLPEKRSPQGVDHEKAKNIGFGEIFLDFFIFGVQSLMFLMLEKDPLKGEITGKGEN